MSVYLASISFSCVNNPSAAYKVVEILHLKCKLTLVNSTPSICTQTRPNCDKKSVCLAKHFTRTNRTLHRHACGACVKFHAIWKLIHELTHTTSHHLLLSVDVHTSVPTIVIHILPQHRSELGNHNRPYPTWL